MKFRLGSSPCCESVAGSTERGRFSAIVSSRVQQPWSVGSRVRRTVEFRLGLPIARATLTTSAVRTSLPPVGSDGAHCSRMQSVRVVRRAPRPPWSVPPS
jgi:hypothetical protein